MNHKNSAELHAHLVREAVSRNRGNYGVAEFGGDVHENLLCQQVSEKLTELLGDRSRFSRIIEIGSGGGRWSRQLTKITDDLICVDATDATADHLSANGINPVVVICKDGKLPSSSGQLLNCCADMLFSFDTFVHFPKDLFDSYVSGISSLLRDGGLFVIHHATNDNKQQHQPTGDPGLWHHYDCSYVDSILKSQGLEIYGDLYAVSGFGSRVVWGRKNE